MTDPSERDQPPAPSSAEPVSDADAEVMAANLDDYVRSTASDAELSED